MNIADCSFNFLVLFLNSPDLHSPQTISNLLSLLLAPITSYVSILTLLAIPSYIPLLSAQSYTTRASIGQAVVSSVLKNNTVIDSSEDVSGVLGLCGVLVRDQKDSSIGGGGRSRSQPVDLQEMAEEQGWLARMVHLFQSDDLSTQFSVSRIHVTEAQTFFPLIRLPPTQLLQTARKHFAEGGERIRYTFPPLIASGIKLARRYKANEQSVSQHTGDGSVLRHDMY